MIDYLGYFLEILKQPLFYIGVSLESYCFFLSFKYKDSLSINKNMVDSHTDAPNDKQQNKGNPKMPIEISSYGGGDDNTQDKTSTPCKESLGGFIAFVINYHSGIIARLKGRFNHK